MDDPNKIPEKAITKPKQVPIKCVVCNGYGKVTYDRVVCHGCSGKGYILVDAEHGQSGMD